LAGDKGYCTKDFVAALRERGIRPHIAFIDDGRRIPGLDQRTIRHASYRLSQRKRKLIEQAFGWLKGVAGIRNRSSAHRPLADAPCIADSVFGLHFMPFFTSLLTAARRAARRRTRSRRARARATSSPARRLPHR
jgi:hypothetical protein